MTKSKFAGTALARGFKTDQSKEQNGVWRVHPESGMHVRIRRATLVEHKRALRRHFKPFSHLPRVDPKDELLVKQKAASEVLVADWGVTQLDENDQPVLDADRQPVRDVLRDETGAPIAASQENVLAAFVEMPDFFAWVTDEADTFEIYRVDAVEESSGNSPPSSDGSDSGEPHPPQPSSNDELNAAISPVPSPDAPS